MAAADPPFPADEGSAAHPTRQGRKRGGLWGRLRRGLGGRQTPRSDLPAVLLDETPVPAPATAASLPDGDLVSPETAASPVHRPEPVEAFQAPAGVAPASPPAGAADVPAPPPRPPDPATLRALSLLKRELGAARSALEAERAEHARRLAEMTLEIDQLRRERERLQRIVELATGRAEDGAGGPRSD